MALASEVDIVSGDHGISEVVRLHAQILLQLDLGHDTLLAFGFHPPGHAKLCEQCIQLLRAH